MLHSYKYLSILSSVLLRNIVVYATVCILYYMVIHDTRFLLLPRFLKHPGIREQVFIRFEEQRSPESRYGLVIFGVWLDRSRNVVC